MTFIACIGAGLALGRYYLLHVDTLFGFGTIYARRYTERGFNSLRPGMSCEQVEAIIGAPLRKVLWPVPAGDEDWWYSKAPERDGNYWRRWVSFRNNRVVATVSRFWID